MLNLDVEADLSSRDVVQILGSCLAIAGFAILDGKYNEGRIAKFFTQTVFSVHSDKEKKPADSDVPKKPTATAANQKHSDSKEKKPADPSEPKQPVGQGRIGTLFTKKLLSGHSDSKEKKPADPSEPKQPVGQGRIGKPQSSFVLPNHRSLKFVDEKEKCECMINLANYTLNLVSVQDSPEVMDAVVYLQNFKSALQKIVNEE